MVTALSNTSSVIPHRAEGTSTVRPRQGAMDGALGSDGALVSVAFDALLDAMRTVKLEVRRGGSAKASPSQMFEAAMPDAHQRRQTALQQEYRAGAQERSVDLDPTGIDARRAAQAKRGYGDDGAAGRHRFPAFGEGSNPIGRPIEFRTDSRSDTAEAARFDQSALRAAREGAFSGRAHLPGAGPTATDAATVYGSAPGRSAPVGGAPAVAGSSVARVMTPAQHTAQLLGAGRVTEVHSAKSATPPAALETHSPSTHTRSSQGRTTGSQGGDTAASRQPADGNPKIADAARSAFDRLVRSIRLQTGARRSSARLQLEPPELGRLHVNLRMEGERLRIEVRTETAAARDLVSGRASQLTAALARHGIHVESFEVTTDFFDEQPHAPSDDDGSGSQTNAEGGDNEWDEASSPAPTYTSPGETEWPDAQNGGQETPIVADTRVDIRV